VTIVADMRRMIPATIVIGVLVLAGCSSDDDTSSTPEDSESSSSSSGPTTTLAPGGSSSPEEAVLAYLDAASKDQWGRVWDGLHPDQKALFTREEFMACSDQLPITFTDAEVVETFEENIALPGVSDSVPSTAVTLTVTGRAGEVEDTQTFTAHAYEVDGQWWSSTSEDKVAECT
jgi:hypothetical protein